MLHGIKCRNCDGNRCAKPYITAYEIAVKHGFQGTEEEWINTIGCIFNARVLSNSGGLWDCDVPYGDLVEIAQYKELHLITLDGKIAFQNGIDDNKVTFCTTSYETDDGTVYDKYELFKSGDGEFEVVDISDETGTITLDRLANGIQTSLGKADTAYQKPAGGIRFEDLQPTVQDSIQAAEMIVVALANNGGDIVVDRENTDLHGYNSILAAVAAGADVRVQYSPSQLGSPWVLHPFIGTANSGAQLIFGGPEYWTDGDSITAMICFYAIYSDDSVDYVAKPLDISYTTQIEYYDVVVSDSGSGFTSSKNFAEITAAHAANKLLRFYYKTFLGSLVEVGENAVIFYALDVTTPATPKLYMFSITGTGTTGAILLQ